MDIFTYVPEYTVEVADHLKRAVFTWTKMQRSGFFKELDALGSSGATRSLRHAGGKAVWIVVGDYHMTYTADPDAKVIALLAARPCGHKDGECSA